MLPTVFAGSARHRPEGEWRRVRPRPFTVTVCRTEAWQVHIDNLELENILPLSEAEQLRGTISTDPTGIGVAHDHFGKAGALKKDVLRNLDPMTFGVRITGDLGRLEPPCCCTIRLTSLSFSRPQRDVPQKHWQIVLAQWVRTLGSTGQAAAPSSVRGGGWHGVLLMVRSPVTWLTSSSFHTFWLLLAPSICGVTVPEQRRGLMHPRGLGIVCQQMSHGIEDKDGAGVWETALAPPRGRGYTLLCLRRFRQSLPCWGSHGRSGQGTQDQGDHLL